MIGNLLTWRRSFAFFVLISATMLAGCSKDERPAVQAAFDEYLAAVLARDGQKAVMRVDQSTIAYYASMKSLALEAGPQEIVRHPISDRILVGIVRATMDLSYLRQLTGEQLFMYSVQEGWAADDEIAAISLDDIQVNGNSASAAAVLHDRPMPLRFEFVKEAGRWRFNFTTLSTVVNEELRKLIAQTGMSENDIILIALTEEVGKPVTSDIWEKPKN